MEGGRPDLERRERLDDAGHRRLDERHLGRGADLRAGIVEPRSDPFALPRVDAHYVRDAVWFERLFTGLFRTYLASRRLVRRLRGKPEGFVSRV